MEGGSKKNNYRVSYTRSKGNSVVHGINESFKDIFNLRLMNTITKWMTLDSKMTYSHEKVDNRQYMNGSDKNPIYAFVTLPRSLSIDVLKAVGIKPLVQGILLWVIISLSTLAYIYFV